MKRVILFISILVSTRSYYIYDDSFEDYDDVDHKTKTYYKPDSTTLKTTYYRNTQNTKATRYEVTENVVDVPDDRTRGPIIVNYSIARNFNTASTIKANNSTNIRKDNNKSEVTKNLQHNHSQYIKPEGKPADSKSSDFWTGIKEIFISGINQAVNKHKHPSLHNILSFLNLQKKDNGDDFHKVFGD